jgi:ABC-type molybdenum transport system ATPase subunit/photorepair protein PhrA
MQSLSIPEDAMNNNCLEFTIITPSYQGHAALRHLSGVVERGSMAAIENVNGSGRSPLMKGIAVLDMAGGFLALGTRPVQAVADPTRYHGG